MVVLLIVPLPSHGAQSLRSGKVVLVVLAVAVAVAVAVTTSALAVLALAVVVDSMALEPLAVMNLLYAST
jgi:hypothetical protein